MAHLVALWLIVFDPFALGEVWRWGQTLGSRAMAETLCFAFPKRSAVFLWDLWCNGFATSVGPHTGQGRFQVVENLTADTALFSSGVPFEFTSVFDGSTLACHYGRTDVANPAKEPGFVQLIPVDPETGMFFAVFLAEFTPSLEDCTGRFAKLKDGSFRMLAVSEVFQADPMTGFGVNPSDPSAPIKYSWYGAGSLKFKKR